MRNDQRLIPFLGGLIVGGVGGAAFDKVNPYQQYYPPYYQYPNYNYYPPIVNQPVPINQSQYNFPYNMYQTTMMVDEEPQPVIITGEERNIKDISYVPIYRP